MISTTDPLSEGSIHDGEDDSQGQQHSPVRRNHSPPSSPEGPPVEVQQEIDAMLEQVGPVDDAFSVKDKIGEGTFSSVYLATLKSHPHIRQQFALKHIIPTSHPSRIESELACMQKMGGIDNVMGVKACIREKDHVVIVMPYFQHDRFQDFVKSCSVADIQDYMKNLFIALRRVHEFNIIHRDVKPSNFLVNKEAKKYALVDFGLAQEVRKPELPVKHSSPVRKFRKEKISSSGSSSPAVHSSSENRTSPRKRKLRGQSVYSQDLPGSPHKRRALASLDGNTPAETLKEIGNTPEAIKSEKAAALLDKKTTMTPPTPDLLSQRYFKQAKSPRRALLTRRALNTEKSKTILDLHQESTRASASQKPAAAPASLRQKLHSSSGNKLGYKSTNLSTCDCFGQPKVCNMCLSRLPQVAPRAGTPGFRSPEVLMKCPDQTTAVDIWSAGVMMLSLLSGRYPFFKANDDLTALAQIISIIGTEEIKKTAKCLGKNIISNPNLPSIDLRVLCEKLRGSSKQAAGSKHGKCKGRSPTAWWFDIPDSAYDLLHNLLDPNPNTRFTASQALSHPFITQELAAPSDGGS